MKTLEEICQSPVASIKQFVDMSAENESPPPSKRKAGQTSSASKVQQAKVAVEMHATQASTASCMQSPRSTPYMKLSMLVKFWDMP